MLEKNIEAYLVQRIHAIGGECEKFTSPMKRSVPDRIVTMPGARIVWVELKRFGRKPEVMQERDHQRRREVWFDVRVIASKEGGGPLIKEVSCLS